MDFKALRERLRAEMLNGASPSSSPGPAPRPGNAAPNVAIGRATHPPAKVAEASSSDATNRVKDRPVSVSLNFEKLLPLAAGNIDDCRLVVDIVSEGEERDLLDAIRRRQDRWVQLSNRRLQQYGGKPMRLGLEDPEPLPTWLDNLAGKLVEGGIFPPEFRPNHVLINEYAEDEGILPHTDGPAYYPMVATISLGSPALMIYEEGMVAWDARRLGQPNREDAQPRVSTQDQQQPEGDHPPVRDAAAVNNPAPIVLPSDRRGRLEAVLPPRSCVITSGVLYSDWLHSIPAQEESTLGENGAIVLNGVSGDRVVRTGTRWSITIRHVPDRSKDRPVPQADQQHAS